MPSLSDIPANVVLIGFKSCGKSTVGRYLADPLNMRFRDLDHTIEELHAERTAEKLSCREIHKRFGAEAFRDLESAAIRRHLDDRGTILATGGGAPLREENAQLLAQIGLVCYIRTPAEVVYERFRRNGMPAYLPPNATFEQVRELWDTRDLAYRRCAGLTIEVGPRSSAEVATEIVNRLQTRAAVQQG